MVPVALQYEPEQLHLQQSAQPQPCRVATASTLTSARTNSGQQQRQAVAHLERRRCEERLASMI